MLLRKLIAQYDIRAMVKYRSWVQVSPTILLLNVFICKSCCDLYLQRGYEATHKGVSLMIQIVGSYPNNVSFLGKLAA